MKSSFVADQVFRVFDKSLELGVCVRCGAPVVFTEGDTVGVLAGKGDTLFYACNVCVDLEEEVFFKNKWYEYYLTR